jgi:hypothetical protein
VNDWFGSTFTDDYRNLYVRLQYIQDIQQLTLYDRVGSFPDLRQKIQRFTL